jgi:hypothetical protein
LLRLEPRIEVWSTDPGDDHQHAERDVDVDFLQVVGVGAAHLQHPRRRPHRRLQGGAVVQVPPGERATGA